MAGLQERLESAFVGEVCTRLPRLLPAVSRLRRLGVNVSPATLRTIVSEVHALASSAVIVGVHDAARAARACEHRLLAYTDGESVPAVVVSEALEHLDRLVDSLSGWHPASAGVA